MDDVKKAKKVADRKPFDPKKFINVEPRLNEATKRNVAVISFGRMNPITIGHEKLVDKVKSVASKEKGDAAVYLSHTSDHKKNPLTYQQKINYAQRAFGDIITKSNSKTIIQIAVELQGKYNNLIVVAGSDRVEEFDTLLNKYNGKDYSFDSIRVVSAGERDPDAEGVAGMSASKLRSLAIDNNLEEFTKGLPKKLKISAEEIMNAIRAGLKISEEIMYEALNAQQRRTRAILMRRLAPKIARGRKIAARKKASNDKLKQRARKQAINALKDKFSRGKTYKELGFAQRQAIDDKVKKLANTRVVSMARKLLPTVKQKERDRFASLGNNSSQTKNESINAKFEAFLAERSLDESCFQDPKVMQRPHLLLTKDGSVKYDMRFKMYKSKNKEVADILDKDLETCDEDVAISLSDIFRLHTAIESLDEAIKRGDEILHIKKGSHGKVTKKMGDDPCWDSHEMVGKKLKGGKLVPNCVPKESVNEAIAHALDPNKTLKHAIKDRGVDYDADGDVDQIDKDEMLPDEITATEPKDLTKVAAAKNKKELQHTKKGNAYESFSKSIKGR